MLPPDIFMPIVLLLVIGYFVLYVGGRYYLRREPFVAVNPEAQLAARTAALDTGGVLKDSYFSPGNVPPALTAPSGVPAQTAAQLDAAARPAPRGLPEKQVSGTIASFLAWLLPPFIDPQPNPPQNTVPVGAPSVNNIYTPGRGGGAWPDEKLPLAGGGTADDTVEGIDTVYGQGEIYGYSCRTNDEVPERPYTTRPIMDLDDYEISAVFQNEGERQASDWAINSAMARYPLSWTRLPPSAQGFQAGKAAAEEEVREEAPYKRNIAPVLETFYGSINGSDMNDYTMRDAARAAEDAHLQMYQPESAQDLTSYNLAELLAKEKREGCKETELDRIRKALDTIYKKKGLIPVVEKSEQGPDVYEITEYKEEHPKIVWEDQVQAEVDRAQARGELQVIVPPSVADIQAGLDPFYGTNYVQTGYPRNEYETYDVWMPELSRPVAPTFPLADWDKPYTV